MAKFRLVEIDLKKNKETGKLESHRAIIWEGKADTLQLSQFDYNIRQPLSISQTHDGIIQVCYLLPSNIIVELEGESFVTAWCKPAMTKEECEKIVTENKERVEQACLPTKTG